MSAATRKDRWLHLRARVGSLICDSVLIAYAFWCVSHLQAFPNGQGFLHQRPDLVWLAPILAAIWQATGTSLGQRAYRLHFKDLANRPVALAPRMSWGLVATLKMTLLAWLGSQGLLANPGVLALLVVGGLSAALWSGQSAEEYLTEVRLRIGSDERRGAIRPWYLRPNTWTVLVLLALTFAVGFQITEISVGALLENISRTKPLVARLTSPDWSIAGQVIDKLVETVFLALMASALSLPFAFILSFFGARNLTRGSAFGRVLYALARVFMNVTRSIEPIIWGIIFIVWVGVGPFAGMLALFIHSVAALGKLYSEAIEGIDPGPVEAIQATGANTLQVLRYGVVPQVIPPFLSFTVYRWDINVRMATILGLIGAGGIGNMLIDFTQLGAWNKVGTVILFITAVVWLMDIGSAKARERLR